MRRGKLPNPSLKCELNDAFKIPKYQNTRTPEYQNTKIPKYQNTKIPKYQNTKIPKFYISDACSISHAGGVFDGTERHELVAADNSPTQSRLKSPR
jgi:hypothetical protein